MMEYILTTDDSSHWFVIPARMRDEWEAWCEETEKYYDEFPDDREPPMLPIWAVGVGGAPSCVSFNEYKID